MWITKITNGVPVSVCEFTVYVFCVCVCVCGVIVVDAQVREHRPNGSLLLDRFCVVQSYFPVSKTHQVVGVKNRQFTI